MNIVSSLRNIAAGLVLVCSLVSPAYSAAYIKFDGVDGESKYEEGAIDLEAFSYDVVSPRDAASGLPTGKRQHKPVFSDITLTKLVDKATPLLFKKCANGTHIANAVLTCRKTGGRGEVYLKVTFQDCIVSSYSPSGGEDEDCDGDKITKGTCSEFPKEELSLSFNKVTYEYTIPTSSGETISETLNFDLTGKSGKPK